MINSVNTFFKLISFEIKKLIKSPLVFGFLILFPFLISVSYGIITKDVEGGGSSISSNIVFVCENVDNLPDLSETIEGVFGEGTEVVWNTDLENSIRDLQLGHINLIIYVDNNNDNYLNIIYDDSNNSSVKYKDYLVLQGYKYSYYTIKEVLSGAGVTIENIDFNLKHLNKDMSTLKMLEPILFAMVIAFILVVGISYTMARDSETGVIKQLSYTPMSINKYLFIRWTFFSVLAILQISIMIFTMQAFGVSQLNYFFALVGIGALFGMAFSSISLMFATAKNQISAISLAIIFIILPIIIIFIGINNFSFLIKLLLYISPLTPFIMAFKSYLNFGVLEPINLLILLAHCVIYFLIASIILNKKYGKKLNKNN